jgi:molybdate transport system substrate-binding protein
MRLITLLSWLVAAAAPAQDQAALRVAVAANFAAPLNELIDVYAETTGESLSASSASTGVLYAQVIHGAPFDLLLAADSERPARLVRNGHALADSLRTYALGRLVLAFRPARDVAAQADADIGTLLATPGITVAIANPELAPYGRAAESVLMRFPAAQPRILTGANVGQAMQMWVTGGADAAFVSASFRPAHSVPVPEDWYAPIAQQAVVLSNSPRRQRARRFLDWLTGTDTARDIIRRHGYRAPEPAHG